MIVRILPAAVVAAAMAFATPPTWAQETYRQPKVDVTKNDKAVRTYQDGIKYYQAGQFKQAKDELEKLLEIMPSHAGGSFMMGLVQLELQDLQKAQIFFRQAIKNDTALVSPRGYLGAVEVFLGNIPGAQKQKEALTKMKTDCAGKCPKAGEIDLAIERIDANIAAASQPQPAPAPPS